MGAATLGWASANSLRRAWRHIITGTDPHYKPLIANSLDAFAWALEANLQKLSQDVLDGSYQPSKPFKCFWHHRTHRCRFKSCSLIHVRSGNFTRCSPKLLVCSLAMIEPAYPTVKSVKEVQLA